jgi:hypothetical protein
MAKTFLDYYNELIGYSGEVLDPNLAKTLVQRAHRDILESRSWSFLMEEGVLQAPAAITSGSVTTTQFSPDVQADATAKTALDAVNMDIPIGTRQFRIGSTTRVYNIDSYDTGTGVLTLKEPFSEPSVTDSGYSVFKCYYLPPKVDNEVDFLRFVSVRDLTNGRPLRLNVHKKELDRRDPMRTSTEPPVVVAGYKADSNGDPLFELWPHPTAARAYVCLFVKKGKELEEDTDSLVYPITDELLITRAQYHLCHWAEMSKGMYPTLRGSDWRFLMGELSARFERLLLQAKKQDDEIFNQNVMMPRRLMTYPPSASYMQEHDTW